MKIFLALLGVSALAFSCSVHSGVLTGSNPNTTIKELAIGEASSNYWFGIGGNSQTALVAQAKRDLYETFPISGNESYSNFTVDFKTSFYLIYAKRQVLVTADIVEPAENKSVEKIRNGELIFADNGDYYIKIAPLKDNSDSSFRVNPAPGSVETTNSNAEIQFFKVDDSVMVASAGSYFPAVIVSGKGDVALIKWTGKLSYGRMDHVKLNRVFLTGDEVSERCDLRYNEELYFLTNNFGEAVRAKGQLVGVRNDQVLVSYKHGKSIKYKVVARKEASKT